MYHTRWQQHVSSSAPVLQLTPHTVSVTWVSIIWTPSVMLQLSEHFSYGRDEVHFDPCCGYVIYWIFISYPSRTYRITEDQDVHHTCNTREKKAHLVHPLAQTLTLTLTLNHLANKPQQTASTLFSLMYLILGSTTINKCTRNESLMNIQ